MFLLCLQSTHKKCLIKCYNHNRKFCTRNYRLLEKYNQNKFSSIVCLKEGMPNGMHSKKDIYTNEKCTSGKKIQLNGSSIKNAKDHKKNMKNKSNIFETNKYSYLEKKIFKELDYENYLKNNRTISDKLYQKIICKKYRLRSFLPLLLFSLLSISLILDYSCSLGLAKGLIRLVSACYGDNKWVSTLGHLLKTTSPFKEFFMVLDSNKKVVNIYVTSLFRTSIYLIAYLMLGVTFILMILYYHKKIKKYEKIKFRNR
ncbi:Plasmodium exported protein (Pm-fam-a like), unknown function [Plasmodium malariae]|uniref:Fam-l protein n=1 Tax=Plasmodium malariae TaxID=5858 RepID=A0A1A8WU45_PLAMA|nr:Plasmodium exported protein (Pm-fam-a like), unknown function [Plasmodium malariae]